ncbi:MAG: S8 family serine peptidase [Acidobacteria bacterium]|nr:S8 family serine peptidase [Acidobacteriota bacterium]
MKHDSSEVSACPIKSRRDGVRVQRLAAATLVLLVTTLCTATDPADASRGSRLAPELARNIANAQQHKTANQLVQVIVQYRQKPTEVHRQRVAALGGIHLSAFNLLKASVEKLPLSAIEQLARDPDVAYITPDRTLYPTSDDQSEQAVGADLEQASGWDGSGVGIAVIDSGISNHNDLHNPNYSTFPSRVVYSQSFVPGNGGIPKSVAVKFDLWNNAGEGANSTGIYTNGALPTTPSTDMTSSGVSLHSGHVLKVHMTYDGSTLTWTITDISNGSAFSTSAPVNIPNLVGSPVAYVGFTGSTGGYASTQDIVTWTYSSGGATPVNFASGFSAPGLSLNGGAAITNARLRLTDGSGGEARSAFFISPVGVQSFTNDFTFQLTNATADGFTFTIQGNDSTMIGPTGGGLGYGTPSGTGDGYGHGTHVAGIIAGNGWNSSGWMFGVSPDANLINLKVLNSNGFGQDSYVISAIEQAIALKSTYNIRVINLSLGRPVYESYTLDPLCQAVEEAWQSGIVVVVAAGNLGRINVYGTQGYGTITAPGNDPYVITVGATNTRGTEAKSDDTIATYSSKGPTPIDHVVKPDLVAPGNNVDSLLAPASTLSSLLPANVISPSVYGSSGSASYFKLSGTSMAAPFVSGAAAMMIEQDSTLTPDTIKARLMKSASKSFPWQSVIYDPGSNTTYTEQYDIFTVGAGYLDVAAAMSSTDVAQGAALSPVAVQNWNGTISIQNLSLPGTSVIWGDSLVWGNSAVWGTTVVYPNSLIWGNSVVWGNSGISGYSVIWGTSVVWGTTINAADAATNVMASGDPN